MAFVTDEDTDIFRYADTVNKCVMIEEAETGGGRADDLATLEPRSVMGYRLCGLAADDSDWQGNTAMDIRPRIWVACADRSSSEFVRS